MSMIDAVTSLMSYALQRETMSLVLMKKRMESEAAIAQMVMDSAKAANQATPNVASTASISRIDTYV
jgi:hypothetical protein